jgi:hypothetical protein
LDAICRFWGIGFEAELYRTGEVETSNLLIQGHWKRSGETIALLYRRKAERILSVLHYHRIWNQVSDFFNIHNASAR